MILPIDEVTQEMLNDCLTTLRGQAYKLQDLVVSKLKETYIKWNSNAKPESLPDYPVISRDAVLEIISGEDWQSNDE
jgi:hypothetical protein